MIIAWIKKRLGCHVCDEFTQWKSYSCRCIRASRPGDGNAYIDGRDVEWTEHWQARSCVICGKVEHSALRYSGETHDTPSEFSTFPDCASPPPSVDPEALAEIVEVCIEPERVKEKLQNALSILRSLYDLQNGPPLIEWTAEWDAAMAEAEKLLEEHDA